MAVTTHDDGGKIQIKLLRLMLQCQPKVRVVFALGLALRFVIVCLVGTQYEKAAVPQCGFAEGICRQRPKTTLHNIKGLKVSENKFVLPRNKHSTCMRPI